MHMIKPTWGPYGPHIPNIPESVHVPTMPESVTPPMSVSEVVAIKTKVASNLGWRLIRSDGNSMACLYLSAYMDDYQL